MTSKTNVKALREEAAPAALVAEIERLESLPSYPGRAAELGDLVTRLRTARALVAAEARRTRELVATLRGAS